MKILNININVGETGKAEDLSALLRILHILYMAKSTTISFLPDVQKGHDDNLKLFNMTSASLLGYLVKFNVNDYEASSPREYYLYSYTKHTCADVLVAF